MKNNIKNTILILLCISIADIISSQDWTILEVAQGTKPAIDIDDDIVQLAFMLEATPGFIKIAEIKGDTINEFLVGEAYYYGPLDIAVGPNGEKGIAVHHHDLQDEVVYLQSSGGSWDEERIVDDGHDGWDNSIAFDSKGYPHTSTINPSQFGSSDGIFYAWKDEDGWTKEVIGSVPAEYMFATSISVDFEDNPHIAYYASGDLYYAVKRQGEWIIEEVKSNGGMYPNLTLDNEGRPHITAYTLSNGEAGTVQYFHQVEEEWNSEDIDVLNNVPITFTGARRVSAIQVDTNGKLHVCYGDRKTVKYAYRDETADQEEPWAIEEIENTVNTDTIFGAQTDLILDSSNNPHITYFQATSLGPLNGVIRYATKEFETAEAVDNDMDGFTADEDCDDSNPDINPGQDEIPNNDIDENCDGNIETAESIYNFEILDAFGEPIDNVVLTLENEEGSVSYSIENTTQLRIANLEDEFPGIEVPWIRIEKKDDADNQVSGLDIIGIVKHILRVETIENPLLQIAADGNGDGSISGLDLITIQKVILRVDDNFPNVDSYIFQPFELRLNDTENNPATLSFTGIKIGDINGN